MHQKLKKEVNWSWTTSNSKVVQNFKKIYKNLHVLNLHNEDADLIFETNASNEHWSAVLKIQKGEKTLQIL